MFCLLLAVSPACAGTGEGAAGLYAAAISSSSEFEALAGESFYAASLGLPQVLFVVDRSQGGRTYYVDSRRYRFHMDFLSDALLSSDKGQVFIENNLDTLDRRFIIGFLLRRGGAFSMEFWEDELFSAGLMAEAYDAVAASFFAPVSIRPSSAEQHAFCRQAGRLPCDPYEPAPRSSYQMLNEGESVGVLRIARGRAPAVLETDILVFPEVPSRVEGGSAFLLSKPATALSHLCILARSMNMPAAYVENAVKSLKKWDGKTVRLKVGPSGYSVSGATAGEAARFAAERRAMFKKRYLFSDLEWRELTDLSGQRRGDVIRFGAKSANLGEMLGSGIEGLSVPPGFTVPFYYYAEFVRRNGLAGAVKSLLEDEKVLSDPRHRARRLEELRSRIQAGAHDPAFAAEFSGKFLERFKGKGVFVRSSTNSEDIPGFTGAGLYTTVPNVRDPEAALAALKAVWASVWNDRAFAARESFGIDHGSVLPAVIIQEGVDADSAGVLLTANLDAPSEKGAVYIAAKQGLGIRVVDGYAVPEQLLYYPASDKLKFLSRSADPVKLSFEPGGGVAEAPAAPGYGVLDMASVRALGRLGLAIEKLFGGLPQDIEWLIKDGRVYVVQARPYPAAPAGGKAGE